MKKFIVIVMMALATVAMATGCGLSTGHKTVMTDLGTGDQYIAYSDEEGIITEEYLYEKIEVENEG